MLALIITLAVIGLLVWLIVTYIPMPAGFRKAILIVAVVCVAFVLLRAFGILPIKDVPVPNLSNVVK